MFQLLHISYILTMFSRLIRRGNDFSTLAKKLSQKWICKPQNLRGDSNDS